MTAFLQAGPVMVPQSTRETIACRWCGRDVVPHPGYGWIHPFDGLVTCDVPDDDPLSVSVARPRPGPHVTTERRRQRIETADNPRDVADDRSAQGRPR
ncbi:hypothetical protein SAMN05444365_10192 [Micromonospora pattaloongensis]|uniref:Uncharacterized protein n=1 Tax=Micromonospora pattaloongensis TaxID=405436 RepID=A0A1H3FNF6_9ACTN|nr:hypothetical protein [Micromonospora pattaloongensis]SDX92450.1 hypothetical protein SAMN05444365_10192 [Micromonospora pattaloongensis]